MNVQLREVAADDGELLFQWANDPAVRQNSFHTAPISREEHQTWFERALSDGNTVIYIYLSDGKPIGQVRLNVTAGIGDVDYSICAEERGKGHAKRMLALAQEKLKAEHPEIRRLHAEVKPENTASKRVFAGLGYCERCVCYEIAL